MNKIHISRNRQTLGEFSPEEVREGLHEGKFLPEDLAWQTGMQTWRPLREVPDLYASETDDSSASPPPLFPERNDSALLPSSDLPPEPAWERRENLGVLTSLVETVKQVLMRPAETFSAMPRTGGHVGPLIFMIMVSWITGAVAIGYQMLATILNPAAIEKELEGISINFFWATMVALIVFMPVIMLVATYFGAGVTHLFLMLCGAAKGGFEATFRVICYAQGATSVLQLIPLCGGVLYSVWYFIAAAIGLIKTHEAEPWRVILALVLPILLCCGLVIMLLGLSGIFAAWVAQAMAN